MFKVDRLLSVGALSLIFLLGGCSRWTRFDLHRMCNIARDHQDDPNFSSRRTETGREWKNLWWISPRTHDLLYALSADEARNRYGMVVHVARDSGASDWDCPEMQAVLSPAAPPSGGFDTGAE